MLFYYTQSIRQMQLINVNMLRTRLMHVGQLVLSGPYELLS